MILIFDKIVIINFSFRMSKAPEEVKSGYSAAVMRTATPHRNCTDPIDDTWVITNLPASCTEDTLGERPQETLRFHQFYIGV